MDVDIGPEETAAIAAENARLRERIETLESELGEQAARANTAIARAQERVLWLDRWHIDLNRAMRRRGAAHVPAAMTLLQRVVRKLKALKRRIAG